MANNKMNAFDLTVSALRNKGLSSDQILEELSELFQNLSSSFPEKKEPEPLSDWQKENKLRGLLRKIGVPRHLKGYPYIIRAVLLYDENKNQLITRDLYPDIAKEFSATGSRVERAIRHAITCTFDRCSVDVIEEFFGNTISYEKGKPTNQEFISMLAELLHQ